MISIVPVILCGGSGTRLWPLSRAGFPKQFLSLDGGDSLFQQAVRRLVSLKGSGVSIAPPLVVTSEDYRFLASEQLREIEVPLRAALLEPTSRNTAPALALAALNALEGSPELVDPILVVVPADQTIADNAKFHEALNVAIREASLGSIVMLGVPPDRPETGYGYIRVKEEGCALDHLTVDRFIEKPNANSAKEYIRNGDYLWNAGIFIMKASVWESALRRFAPSIFDSVKLSWEKREVDGPFIRPEKTSFEAIPKDSIDYAVIEHCPGTEFRLKVVPLRAGWNDLGSWEAVWTSLPKDTNGNVHLGDVLAIDAKNTLVNTTDRMVALIGVDDIVVIETPDAVLIADKSRSQNVKELVSSLAERGRNEHLLHRKVHRPWGWYDSVDEGERFKVKRIYVHPKASLSLQIHHHRAEHWIVVKGTAEVTKADEVILLTENQSTYIPLGAVHRLRNPGSIPLEIIEVQSGSYLGEDDIVRYVDQYGRID